MSFKDAMKNSKKKGKNGKKPVKDKGKMPFDEMDEKMGGRPNPFEKFEKKGK